MKPHIWFFALALVAMPLCAQAAPTYDVQIPSGGIRVSSTPVMLGQTVKLYVTVDNIGDNDVEGTAIFQDDGQAIGIKAISARASGNPEEVWQIWTPKTVGNHTIDIKLVPDDSISDGTPNNNEAQITVFVDKDTDHDNVGDSVDPDIDGDGVANGQDQFPTDPTRSKDTDGDGIDDSIDSDIDNDGLYNWDEKTIGTDPTKYDTDGDHVGDKEDAFPLDPKRWDPEPAPVSNTSGGNSSGSQTPSDNSTNSGTNPSDIGTSNNSAGGQDTSTGNSQGADGQVLGIKISGSTSTDSSLSPTSTAELLVATSTQITTSSHDAVPPPPVLPIENDDQTGMGDKSSWNLSLALWGIAIIFGGLAGLFIWLAERRGKRGWKGSRK